MDVMKKAIYTLCVDDYCKEITDMTFPLLKVYAKKIGADFKVISQRRFPDYPAAYEKLQIGEMGGMYDWNIYIDADALVHPDAPDFTTMLQKNTVAHFGRDSASQRWQFDEYFRRDGRHIGSGNWFTMASNWCLDLWKPLDISLEDALKRINPVIDERLCGIDSAHLLDDYTLSRNIARYGLKFKTLTELMEEYRIVSDLFFHIYQATIDQKVQQIQQRLKIWRLV